MSERELSQLAAGAAGRVMLEYRAIFDGAGCCGLGQATVQRLWRLWATRPSDAPSGDVLVARKVGLSTYGRPDRPVHGNNPTPNASAPGHSAVNRSERNSTPPPRAHPSGRGASCPQLAARGLRGPLRIEIIRAPVVVSQGAPTRSGLVIPGLTNGGERVSS
jgi:hypothetical protein